MTSPSLPVSCNPPLPGNVAASICKIAPPTGVQARPTATPGGSSVSRSSSMNRAGPRSFCSEAVVTRNGGASPSAFLRASLRATDPTSRSRLRSPASRV